MNDILKELESAFELASKIPVSGDYVDIMCGVRESLRKAYKLAQSEPLSEVTDHGGQTDLGT